MIGDGIYQIGLMWWVMDKTGSATAMATVAIFASVPGVLLGPIAGVYVDRWDRRRLMIWTDLLRAGVIAVPALLLEIGRLEVWHIYIVATLLSTFSTFFFPAMGASIPNIVRKEQLTRANSINYTTFSLSGILGPALGGMAVATLGTKGTMYLDALTFVMSGIAIFIASIPSPSLQRVAEESKSVLGDLKAGLAYLFAQKLLFGMMILSSIANFFAAPIGILIPIMAKQVLNVGPEGFGYLSASLPIGMLIGSLALGAMKEVHSRGVKIIWSMILAGLCLSLFGVSRNLWLSMGIFIIGGAFIAVINVLIQVIFQTFISDEMRGRVFGAIGTLSQGLRPIALGFAGGLTDALGAPLMLIISGIAVAISSLLGGYLVPGLRKLD